MELGDRLGDERRRRPRELNPKRTLCGPPAQIALAIVILVVVGAEYVAAAQSDTAAPTGSAVRGVRPVEPRPVKPSGRLLYVVIGIDSYKSWPHLQTAVSDAKGVAKVLEDRFGFSAVSPPLINGRATRSQIDSLINDVLPHKLQPDDRLVLFFAGHGTTRVDQVGDKLIESGFVVPVDAPADHEKAWSSYIALKGLLDSVAVLPARHVLIVLDSCHSGFAVGASMSSFRGAERYKAELEGRLSRRIITSARRDQLASDDGPIPGHSLFTGTLIQGLESGQADTNGDGLITSSEIGLYLQQTVGQSAGSKQVPDFGSFQLDDRGELVLPVRRESLEKVSRGRATDSRSGDTDKPRAGDASSARLERDLGLDLLKQRKYREAVNHLIVSHRLVPNAQIAQEIADAYLNMATLEEKSKDKYYSGADFVEAYDWAEKALRFELPPDERTRATDRRDGLADHVAILDITTTPPSCDVYLDSEELGTVGRAPLRRAVSPGPHLIIVKLAGHHDAQTRITANIGQTVATDLTPEPIVGRLRVTSDPPGAHIVVESTGDVIGVTPLERTQPVGPVRLIVSSDGFVDVTREVNVAEDGVATFAVTLQRAAQNVATLSVTGEPVRASVHIGATSYGEIPTSLGALRPGKTRLEITAPGHDSWASEVPLEAGAATRVSVRLAPTAKPVWRGWKWVGFAGGGALLLSGAAVGIAAKNASADYWRDPSRGGLDGVRSLNTTADVLMSVGATAILATEVVRWLWPAPATSRADVTLAR